MRRALRRADGPRPSYAFDEQIETPHLDGAGGFLVVWNQRKDAKIHACALLRVSCQRCSLRVAVFQEEGDTLLCHRILVDGGAIRLITPDFMSFARAYVEGDEEFYKVASPYEPKPIRGINLMMRQDGAHHYIFDSEELIDMLRGSGFSDVYQSACGDSKFKDLDLDQTHELRVHESLYVEAVK